MLAKARKTCQHHEGLPDFRDPLFWAVLIAWILSVVLHEFAHGIVAYWGGDYTIRERGGLTLNPLQYVDPVFSILLPVVFLCMGGIPLPGGSTFIRRDLLYNKKWDSAVSLAGPAMNILIFIACTLPLLPRFGWLDPDNSLEWTSAQLLLGTMALLQLFSVFLNLVPVPPLDGFQALSPWLSPDLRRKLSTPPWSTGLTIGFFIVIFKLPVFDWFFHGVAMPIFGVMGFDNSGQWFFARAFNQLLAPK